MIWLSYEPGYTSFEVLKGNALLFYVYDLLLSALLSSLDDSSEKEELESVCDELDSETCSRIFVL